MIHLKKSIEEAKEARIQLKLTEHAYTLWLEVLNSSNLTFDWRTKFLAEIELIISAIVLHEWGENTACVLDRAKQSLEVENLDGRKKAFLNELKYS